jgi:hypothetical protein
MDVFHLIVLTVASVSLILVLTTMGILLRKDNYSKKFPTSHSMTPDGWTLNDVVVNNEVTGKTLTSDGTNPAGIVAAPKSFTITEWDDICLKKTWADQENVYWDGITTYNGC